MNKKKTAIEKLQEKVSVLEYTDDIHHNKPIDLDKALSAARKLKGSVFYDDENSVRAEPTFQS